MNPTRIRARVSLLVLLAFAAIGAVALACLPIPHSQRESPEIDGVIRREGAPMPGVHIRIAVNRHDPHGCANARQEVVSDAQGRFRFRSTSYFSPAFIFGDRRDDWTVCFAFPGALRAAWAGSGWWGGPPRVHLDCNVTSDPNPLGVITLNDRAPSSDDGCVATEIRPR
jgi:hypothetical protein